MKNNLSRLVLITFDVIAIYISIILAFLLRMWLDPLFGFGTAGELTHYTDKLIVYIVVVITFLGLSIYKYRHDFWEETSIVLKSLALSLVLVLSVLALSKSVENYSRFIILASFAIMAFVIPIFKFILKKKVVCFWFMG